MSSKGAHPSFESQGEWNFWLSRALRENNQMIA